MLVSTPMADTRAIVQRWRRGLVAAELRSGAQAAVAAGRPAKAVGEALSALSALAALAALEAMGRWGDGRGRAMRSASERCAWCVRAERGSRDVPEQPRARSKQAPLEEALAALAVALDSANVPWTVIGGTAAVARGVTRTTTDIGVVVRGDRIGAPALVTHLASHGIGGRIPDATAFAARNMVILARHTTTGVDLDIILGWTTLEHEAIADSTLTAFGRVVVPVALARDLIVFEVAAGRPKDIDDATTLLAADRKIDVARIRARVAALAEAADAPELHATLARVLDRVRAIRRLTPKRQVRT